MSSAAFSSTAAAPFYVDGFPLHKMQAATRPELPKVVLVECGSFSPVNSLHILLFEMSRDTLTAERARCEIVGGVMSPVHDAYGKKSLVAAHHRVAMCDIACEDSSWIATSRWETRQGGWVRTRAVLQKYQDILDASGLYPLLPAPVSATNTSDTAPNPTARCPITGHVRKSNVTVKLVCGVDVLQSMAVPGLWQEADLEALLGTFGVVVTNRDGLTGEEVIATSPILQKYAWNIDVCPPRMTSNLSSTLARGQLCKGMSTKMFIPDKVEAYIREHNLYSIQPSLYPPAPALSATPDTVARVSAALAAAGMQGFVGVPEAAVAGAAAGEDTPDIVAQFARTQVMTVGTAAAKADDGTGGQ